MTRIQTYRLGACLFCAAVFLQVGIGAKAQKSPDKTGSSKDTDAGIRFRLQVSEKEIGLPIYPGAKPHSDEKGESPSANIGLWGKTFGFKLVVLKMESTDSQAKVAAFYRKALAKYGKVLDCSHSAKKSDAQDTKKSRDALTCDDDTTPDGGGIVYKSGTNGKQHIVSIEQDGQGSIFHMVLLDTRGIDEDQRPQ
jgi:hypothetical protein